MNKKYILLVLPLFLIGCNSTQQANNSTTALAEDKPHCIPMTEKIEKDDQEWQKELTETEFFVTRKKGTERAFTGAYYNNKETGVYHCKCCKSPLFTSDTKFDSGTGWPSFFKPVSETSVTMIEDKSHGMVRTEVVCSKCDAHLGHVFDDGPKPTGQRYCINSVSLDFTPEKK